MRFSRRTMNKAGAVGIAVGVVAGSMMLPLSAASGADFAPKQQVTVDLGSDQGPATRTGIGFLYGLSRDGQLPSDQYMAPLAPTLFRGGGAGIGTGWSGDGFKAGTGYKARITAVIAQAKRVSAAPYGARYHVLLSDLYRIDTSKPSNPQPCDNNDCSNWTALVRQAITDIKAAGLSVDYDVYNEGNISKFWTRGVNSPQFFAMWDSAYRVIREMDPEAKIVGPSYSRLDPAILQPFLVHAKDAGTVPDILNWHFGDYDIDPAVARKLLNDLALPQLPITINEYSNQFSQNAGFQAWAVSQLANNHVQAAARGIWQGCCTSPTLDNILGLDANNPTLTGQWWTYQAYASITGDLVTTTGSGGTVAGVAGKDQAAQRVVALVGDKVGATDDTAVTVTGFDSVPWLTTGHKVQVSLERIPDGPLQQPIVVSNTVVDVKNGSLDVPIHWQAAYDAYAVVITPNKPYQDTDSDQRGVGAFNYGPGWNEDNLPGASNGSVATSSTPASSATYRFAGTQAQLFFATGPDQGQAQVSIDGVVQGTVDLYNKNRHASEGLYTTPTMFDGMHTVTVTVTGAGNPASTGTAVSIDKARATLK